jgi:hypothetical protein
MAKPRDIPVFIGNFVYYLNIKEQIESYRGISNSG